MRTDRGSGHLVVGRGEGLLTWRGWECGIEVVSDQGCLLTWGCLPTSPLFRHPPRQTPLVTHTLYTPPPPPPYQISPSIHPLYATAPSIPHNPLFTTPPCSLWTECQTGVKTLPSPLHYAMRSVIIGDFLLCRKIFCVMYEVEIGPMLHSAVKFPQNTSICRK